MQPNRQIHVQSWLWTYFAPCSSVFIVNFDQINTGWEAIIHSIQITSILLAVDVSPPVLHFITASCTNPMKISSRALCKFVYNRELFIVHAGCVFSLLLRHIPPTGIYAHFISFLYLSLCNCNIFSQLYFLTFLFIFNAYLISVSDKPWR